ncbi:putative carbohydrate kinase [Proteiniphilum saccharofermentans]|uniref:Bifunctional NAD(P)H-hydrate repair enzyme n=1 Tax=Proteiniphilum saccharofermentans TaxID=1642647 RepID=A0A1R3T197_9BACT|nr:bifunctional ADP-dependent NAD(P)H-hydrate dehydratase/NAD(P)H-hydrate epimerase [Proteiniphilum saccharofermentans]SCD20920.1 putative carbohydrate kinase [Proteiniphilum saccharofermentans]
MKILTSEQIRKVDAETITREGISSLELMKRAATAFYRFFTEKYTDRNTSVIIFAGVGNNGGDALVVARLLYKAGYSVKAYMVEFSNRYTEDCAHNIRRVKAENIPYKKILNKEDIPDLSPFDVVIDGIFGTGLSREVSGIAADVITRINESGKEVVSIDVPSGLFPDRKTEFAVKATETVTFQIPKLALYLPENAGFTGNVRIVNIGLNQEAIAEAETDIYLTEKREICNLLKPLSKFAHKGTQGHALIIGGSLGKCGSVSLASKAALKTGCGLVTAYLPKCGVPAIQSGFPEAMALEDEGEEHIRSIDYDLKPDAIGIGMGMGLHEETAQAMCQFLQQKRTPLAVDADGLNILSRHPDWLGLLPAGTILTPHPKELQRMIGEWCDDYEKIEKTKALANRYGVILVVKGAYSMIIDGEKIYVNSSGTPALATAGSGDVLTGMITGLLAQGYKPSEAARIGVFLHGMTADIAGECIHPRSFVASDIIENIGNAYRSLEKKN